MNNENTTPANHDHDHHILNRPRSERVNELFGFQPFDYQAEVLDADARRTTWVCGRQVGKSENRTYSLLVGKSLHR